MANSRKKQDSINACLRRIYHERREAALWLLGGCCTYCGVVKNLQFDHIDPAYKKFSITRYIRWKQWDDIMAELSKCQLLCRKCHKNKTKKIDGIEAKHGTGGMYRHHKCRCAACREVNNFYAREHKARRTLGEVASR